jgi:hypothetical protein
MKITRLPQYTTVAPELHNNPPSNLTLYSLSTLAVANIMMLFPVSQVYVQTKKYIDVLSTYI